MSTVVPVLVVLDFVLLAIGLVLAHTDRRSRLESGLPLLAVGEDLDRKSELWANVETDEDVGGLLFFFTTGVDSDA